MKIAKRHTFMLVMAILSLIAGVLNYLIYQPDIILIHYFKLPFLANLRSQSKPLQYFLRGYFSDITWCTALCLITIVLSELKFLSFGGKIFIFTLPILTETAQYFGVIHGTFDWLDILTYVFIIFVFVLFFPTLKKMPDEKT